MVGGRPEEVCAQNFAFNVNCVNNKGLRTFLSVGTGIAVIFFGSRPSADGSGGITNALLVLGVLAAVLVWFLTKPNAGKPVS